MERVKMDVLDDIILVNKDKDSVVAGYTTKFERDIDGEEFEVLAGEVVYYRVVEIMNSALYVSQERLFEILTQSAEHDFYTEDIYAHGYPEARLIPSDHKEKSEEAFIEMHLKMFEDNLRSVIPQYSDY